MMDFFKYEATGNDFIILDATSGEAPPTPQAVRDLCARHTGIGADGVLVVAPSSLADIRMRVFNADGSESGMCGNGVRAVVLFAFDNGLLAGEMAEGRTVAVETNTGVRDVTCLGRSSGVPMFRVDMGAPSYTRGALGIEGPENEEAVGVPVVSPDGYALEGTCVSMGNPHCVFFVDDVASYPVSLIGPAVENDALFPGRTNVEFVEVMGDGALRVRVWERGVGETMACGTGACAAVVAAYLNGLTKRSAAVTLPGGQLDIRWDGNVFMAGPARRVFNGRMVDIT